MDTNKTELSMDELELANGGWKLTKFIGGAFMGGGIGAVGGAALAIAVSGPVGWLIAGGAVAGAAAIGTLCGSEIVDEIDY